MSTNVKRVLTAFIVFGLVTLIYPQNARAGSPSPSAEEIGACYGTAHAAKDGKDGSVEYDLTSPACKKTCAYVKENPSDSGPSFLLAGAKSVCASSLHKRK